MHSYQYSKLASSSYQKGDFLIEALIGALLIGIVGVGIATTATQVTKSQIVSQRQSTAISNLEGAASGGDIFSICSEGGIANLGADVVYKPESACDGAAVKAIGVSLSNEQLDINQPIVTNQPLVLSAELTLEAGQAPIELQVGQITP